MPHALLRSDCEVLDRPDPAEFSAAIRKLVRPGLIIFGYPYADLTELAPLASLEVLGIEGAKCLQSLSGIERLQNLREFILSTPTSADGSGQFIGIDSFAPLATLPNLRKIKLLHVQPRDLDLTPLMAMQQLEEIDIGSAPGLEVEHFARLAAALPNAKGRCLQPFFSIPGVGLCKKCKAQRVMITGPRPKARRWLCPTCDARQLARHCERWDAAFSNP